MDDDQLRTLGREHMGEGGRPRQVEDVLRRGRTLRRRTVAARTVPALAVVALAATAGVAALRSDPQPALATIAGSPGLPAKVAYCDIPGAEPVPVDQLDGLRLVPAWLPPGIAVAAAEAVRQPTQECTAVEPALVLRAVDNGSVTAEIVLEGPFGRPYEGDDEILLEPTELRSGEAARLSESTGAGSFVGYTWTEPDGGSWVLAGVGTDEATVRAVAEALDLAAPPTADEPPAELDDDAVPAGFELAWRAPGLPAVEDPARLAWRVTTTDPGYPPCEVTIAMTDRRAPPGRLYTAGPDSRAAEVEVRGGPGFAIEEHGITFLDWSEAPGVAGSLRCPGEVDTALRIADSLVEVAPTDPRITDR
jgi:hypothetical protein